MTPDGREAAARVLLKEGWKVKNATRIFRTWLARFCAPDGLLICYKSISGPTREAVMNLRVYADAMARLLPASVREEIEKDCALDSAKPKNLEPPTGSAAGGPRATAGADADALTSGSPDGSTPPRYA